MVKNGAETFAKSGVYTIKQLKKQTTDFMDKNLRNR